MTELTSAPTNSLINSGFRRVVSNVASIFASDIVNRVATFIIYALVARYLGTYKFGQMSLAWTFFQTFQLLAIAGLQTFVTREVSRNRDETDVYLLNSSLSVTGFSVVSIIIMLLVSYFMAYAADTQAIIMLMALGLLPYALSIICDAIFQAWEQMHFITYTNLFVNILKVGLIFALLNVGLDLTAIVIILFISHVLTWIVKLALIFRYISRPTINFSMPFIIKTAKSTLTFLGIDGLMAFMSSYEVILLSKMAGEVEVGLFNAANQVMVPISLVFQSILVGVFPLVCKSFSDTGVENLKRISEQLLELLLLLVIPSAVGIYFLAEDILLLLYGNEDFSMAVIALQVLVGVLILRVFTQVLGRALLASLRERTTLRILMIDLITSAILGPILIWNYGIFGAALTSLIVRIIDFIQHYVYTVQLFSRLNLLSAIWKPLLASVVMGLFLIYAAGANLALVILSAAVLYAVALFVIMVLAAGGWTAFKNQYLSPIRAAFRTA